MAEAFFRGWGDEEDPERLARVGRGLAVEEGESGREGTSGRGGRSGMSGLSAI